MLRTKGITAMLHTHVKALKGFKKFISNQVKAVFLFSSDGKGCYKEAILDWRNAWIRKGSSPVTFPLSQRADRSSLFMTCLLPASALFSAPQLSLPEFSLSSSGCPHCSAGTCISWQAHELLKIICFPRDRFSSLQTVVGYKKPDSLLSPWVYIKQPKTYPSLPLRKQTRLKLDYLARDSGAKACTWDWWSAVTLTPLAATRKTLHCTLAPVG